MIKFIDVDRILKLCILYIYIYIKSISGFLKLICLERISFRLNCFEFLFILSPFVLGLFLQILPVIVNRQIKCRWQEDNK